MSNKFVGSDFDEFLSQNDMLDEAAAVAVNRVSAWQFEQELKAGWAEVERGKNELIPAPEVFADIRRKF